MKLRKTAYLFFALKEERVKEEEEEEEKKMKRKRKVDDLLENKRILNSEY